MLKCKVECYINNSLLTVWLGDDFYKAIEIKDKLVKKRFEVEIVMKLEKYLNQEQLNKILQENFKKLLAIIIRIEEIEHDLIELRIKSNKFPTCKVEVDNPNKYKLEYEIAINELKNLYEMGENILTGLYDNVDKGIACEMLSNIKHRSRLKNMLQLLDN